MSNSKNRYKSNFVEIDLNKNQYKLEFGKKWASLPKIIAIKISEVSMTQNAGGRVGRVNHKYKAYCVYIKSKKSHLMVFRGSKEDAEIEQQKLISIFKNQNLSPDNKRSRILNQKKEKKLPLIKIILLILPLAILIILSFGT